MLFYEFFALVLLGEIYHLITGTGKYLPSLLSLARQGNLCSLSRTPVKELDYEWLIIDANHIKVQPALMIWLPSPKWHLSAKVIEWSPLPKRHLKCQSDECYFPLMKEATEMTITTIGIVLAKYVFVLRCVDELGNAVLRKQLRREQMMTFFARQPSCLIGMEACGNAHYWANKLQGLGHTVKLMAPQFVKPYVKTNKNDAADAEAICEAVTRPSMRFVPIKSSEQLAILALHRVRQGFVKARTAQTNQVRGLLVEYGIILPQGIAHIGKQFPEILEDDENGLPGTFRQLLVRLNSHLKALDQQVSQRKLEEEIELWHRGRASSQTLAQLPGIGPITASALVASMGIARNFNNDRQLAA